ncbi:MAG: hypothetical protein WB239_06480 [Acidimicrobiia bacterium]
MQVGEIWAYRDKPRRPGAPVQAVEVLQDGPPRSPKRVRIRWVDGEYAGLDEWVSLSRLICPWPEVEQILEQERLHMALAASVRGYDEVKGKAADFVLDGVLGLSAGVAVTSLERGDEGMFIVWDTDRLPHTTRDELMTAPGSYLTQGGTYYGPLAQW